MEDQKSTPFLKFLVKEGRFVLVRPRARPKQSSPVTEDILAEVEPNVQCMRKKTENGNADVKDGSEICVSIAPAAPGGVDSSHGNVCERAANVKDSVEGGVVPSSTSAALLAATSATTIATTSVTTITSTSGTTSATTLPTTSTNISENASASTSRNKTLCKQRDISAAHCQRTERDETVVVADLSSRVKDVQLKPEEEIGFSEASVEGLKDGSGLFVNPVSDLLSKMSNSLQTGQDKRKVRISHLHKTVKVPRTRKVDFTEKEPVRVANCLGSATSNSLLIPMNEKNHQNLCTKLNNHSTWLSSDQEVGGRTSNVSEEITHLSGRANARTQSSDGIPKESCSNICDSILVGMQELLSGMTHRRSSLNERVEAYNDLSTSLTVCPKLHTSVSLKKNKSHQATEENTSSCDIPKINPLTGEDRDISIGSLGNPVPVVQHRDASVGSFIDRSTRVLQDLSLGGRDLISVAFQNESTKDGQCVSLQAKQRLGDAQIEFLKLKTSRIGERLSNDTDTFLSDSKNKENVLKSEGSQLHKNSSRICCENMFHGDRILALSDRHLSDGFEGKSEIKTIRPSSGGLSKAKVRRHPTRSKMKKKKSAVKRFLQVLFTATDRILPELKEVQTETQNTFSASFRLGEVVMLNSIDNQPDSDGRPAASSLLNPTTSPTKPSHNDNQLFDVASASVLKEQRRTEEHPLGEQIDEPDGIAPVESCHPTGTPQVTDSQIQEFFSQKSSSVDYNLPLKYSREILEESHDIASPLEKCVEGTLSLTDAEEEPEHSPCGSDISNTDSSDLAISGISDLASEDWDTDSDVNVQDAFSSSTRARNSLLCNDYAHTYVSNLEVKSDNQVQNPLRTFEQIAYITDSSKQVSDGANGKSTCASVCLGDYQNISDCEEYDNRTSTLRDSQSEGFELPTELTEDENYPSPLSVEVYADSNDGQQREEACVPGLLACYQHPQFLPFMQNYTLEQIVEHFNREKSDNIPEVEVADVDYQSHGSSASLRESVKLQQECESVCTGVDVQIPCESTSLKADTEEEESIPELTEDEEEHLRHYFDDASDTLSRGSLNDSIDEVPKPKVKREKTTTLTVTSLPSDDHQEHSNGNCVASPCLTLEVEDHLRRYFGGGSGDCSTATVVDDQRVMVNEASRQATGDTSFISRSLVHVLSESFEDESNAHVTSSENFPQVDDISRIANVVVKHEDGLPSTCNQISSGQGPYQPAIENKDRDENEEDVTRKYGNQGSIERNSHVLSTEPADNDGSVDLGNTSSDSDSDLPSFLFPEENKKGQKIGKRLCKKAADMEPDENRCKLSSEDEIAYSINNINNQALNRILNPFAIKLEPHVDVYSDNQPRVKTELTDCENGTFHEVDVRGQQDADDRVRGQQYTDGMVGGEKGTDDRARGQQHTDDRVGGKQDTDDRLIGQQYTDGMVGGEKSTDDRARGQQNTDDRVGGQQNTDDRVGDEQSIVDGEMGKQDADVSARGQQDRDFREEEVKKNSSKDPKTRKRELSSDGTNTKYLPNKSVEGKCKGFLDVTNSGDEHHRNHTRHRPKGKQLQKVNEKKHSKHKSTSHCKDNVTLPSEAEQSASPVSETSTEDTRFPMDSLSSDADRAQQADFCQQSDNCSLSTSDGCSDALSDYSDTLPTITLTLRHTPKKYDRKVRQSSSTVCVGIDETSSNKCSRSEQDNENSNSSSQTMDSIDVDSKYVDSNSSLQNATSTSSKVHNANSNVHNANSKVDNVKSTSSKVHDASSTKVHDANSSNSKEHYANHSDSKVNEKSKVHAANTKVHAANSKGNNANSKGNNVNSTSSKMHDVNSKVHDANSTSSIVHNEKSNAISTSSKVHGGNSSNSKVHNEKSKVHDANSKSSIVHGANSSNSKVHNEKSKVSNANSKVHNANSTGSKMHCANSSNYKISKVNNLNIPSSKLHNVNSKVHDANSLNSKVHDANSSNSKVHDANSTSSKVHDANSKSAKVHDEKSKVHNPKSKVHNANSKVHDGNSSNSKVHGANSTSSKVHDENSTSIHVPNEKSKVHNPNSKVHDANSTRSKVHDANFTSAKVHKEKSKVHNPKSKVHNANSTTSKVDDVNSQSSNVPFQCSTCSKVLTSASALRRHIRIHRAKKYTCSVCDMAFYGQGNLTQHLIVHTGQTSECPVCGRLLAGSMKMHMCKHSGEKLYECNICGMRFSAGSSLRSHSIQHSNLSVKCDVCDKQFRDPKLLERHMKIHDSRMFDCEVCMKAFKRRSHLEKHMNKIHTGQKDCKCYVCGARFSTLDGLKQHMFVHTGQRNFQCDVCQKKFAKFHNLRIHLRIHTGQNVYKCHICGKCFGHAGTVKLHMAVHTGARPFRCETCGKAFTQSSHLSTHQRVHSAWTVDCNKCDRKFLNEQRLNKHMKTHQSQSVKQFKCDICLKQLMTRKGLLLHKKRLCRKTVRQFQCDQCEAKFMYEHTLKQHQKRHSLQGEFPCSVCQKTFALMSKLVKHQVKIHLFSTCSLCKANFPSVGDLDLHLKDHRTVGGGRYSCSQCPVVLPALAEMEEHMQTHRRRTVRCPTCNKYCASKALLQEHTNRMHPLAEAQYGEESDRATESQTLDTQQDENSQTCSRMQTFRCDVCEKTFQEEHSFLNHASRHKTQDSSTREHNPNNKTQGSSAHEPSLHKKTSTSNTDEQNLHGTKRKTTNRKHDNSNSKRHKSNGNSKQNDSKHHIGNSKQNSNNNQIKDSKHNASNSKHGHDKKRNKHCSNESNCHNTSSKHHDSNSKHHDSDSNSNHHDSDTWKE